MKKGQKYKDLKYGVTMILSNHRGTLAILRHCEGVGAAQSLLKPDGLLQYEVDSK